MILASCLEQYVLGSFSGNAKEIVWVCSQTELLSCCGCIIIGRLFKRGALKTQNVCPLTEYKCNYYLKLYLNKL